MEMSFSETISKSHYDILGDWTIALVTPISPSYFPLLPTAYVAMAKVECCPKVMQ